MKLNDLINKCKDNNRAAQGELYNLYKDQLFTLCLKYCKNTQEAEDNLQESFLTIFDKIKGYKSIGSFEGWMKRITINKAIDKYHRKKIQQIPIKEDILSFSTVEIEHKSYSLEYLLLLIQELPNKYRLVFNLYELDEYSHKEIAKMLHISIGTSKSNLHRAKLILKTRLEQTKKIVKSHG